MTEPYRWKLSPSKFEASKGCPCFTENQNWGQKYKDRGTDLHKLVEVEDAPLDGLEPNDCEAVLYCRNFMVELRELLGIRQEWKELSVAATDRHPRGKLDWVFLTEDGQLFVFDWKFGEVEVRVEDNPQLEAYALMAYDTVLGRLLLPVKVDHVTVGVVQPALDSKPTLEIPLSRFAEIEANLKLANDRVTDPVKLPDASDPDKCRRCEHLHRCPAVVKGVSLATSNFGLPMPENFDPGALVTERQRVIGQDLAVILEAWAKQVKAKNKEYAIQNGGTIGGIWSVSQRSNGVEIQDLRGFADALVADGVLESPDQILDFVALRKGALIEGLSGPDRDVAPIVKKLEECFGVPRPPVSVFRRGGKKQVKAAEELLDIPMLENPFKKKHSDE